MTTATSELRCVTTATGRVYQTEADCSIPSIDWAPPEPMRGHEVLTGGVVEQLRGVGSVVTFDERGEGASGRQVKISCRLDGRPDLAELAAIAEQMERELRAERWERARASEERSARLHGRQGWGETGAEADIEANYPGGLAAFRRGEPIDRTPRNPGEVCDY